MIKLFLLVAAISLTILPTISRAASHHSVSKRVQHRSRTSRRRARSRRKHSRRRSRARAYQLHPTAERYKQIQQALADQGCYDGDIDGIWGPESVAALQRFQTERGIENEGKITALALIGLGLGPKHTSAIPVVSAHAAQPVDDSESTPDGRQQSTPLPPDGAATASP